MGTEPTDELEVIESGGGSLEQITRAEIDIQISTAKKYPRVLSKVRDDVLTLATMDEETAAACFFSLPRAGKDITGESVRLAEILASCYGHIRAAWRPVTIDRQNGTVTCQGTCHDLEKNSAASLEKTRKIQKKKGSNSYDEDMITLAINACGAIAYRDAVFKVVPKALIKPILKDIKEAARGKGTMQQRVERVLERFRFYGEKEGIKPADMDKRALAAVEAEKKDDITLTKLDMLIGMGTAIADGEVRLQDQLPDPKKADDGFKKAPDKPKNEGESKKQESPKTEGPEPPEQPAGETEEGEATDLSGEEPGDTDTLAALMLDVEGFGDASCRKAAIALGILPREYAASVMEAEPQQVGAMIRRFDELTALKLK